MVFPQHIESSPFEIRSKDVWETKHLRQMKFILDDCMDAVLKDINNTPLLSVCHDDVMHFGNGILRSDVHWPSLTGGVVFKTFLGTFEFSSPLFHHAV